MIWHNRFLRRVNPIELEDACARLEDSTRNGYIFQPRVRQMLTHSVDYSGDIKIGHLESRDAFLSLVWHAIAPCLVLTPQGKPRTLRAVVDRAVSNGWTLENLASDPDRDPKKYFGQCYRMYAEGFDHNKMHYLLIQGIYRKERLNREYENGEYYIIDGCHRTLVYAYALIIDNLDYTPVQCLLVKLPENYNEHDSSTWPPSRKRGADAAKKSLE